MSSIVRLLRVIVPKSTLNILPLTLLFFIIQHLLKSACAELQTAKKNTLNVLLIILHWFMKSSPPSRIKQPLEVRVLWDNEQKLTFLSGLLTGHKLNAYL
jgi:hypothetical protein